MTGPTIRYQVRFRGRESALVAPRAADAAQATTTPTAASGAPTPTARLLALAYAIERHVRAGTLRDYREAAWRLGVSHARISQLVSLLLLDPSIQAEVLAGRLTSERALRRAAQLLVWPRTTS